MWDVFVMTPGSRLALLCSTGWGYGLENIWENCIKCWTRCLKKMKVISLKASEL